MNTRVDYFTIMLITPCLPFSRKRSPDGAAPEHPIAAYYSFIDPEGMKG